MLVRTLRPGESFKAITEDGQELTIKFIRIKGKNLKLGLDDSERRFKFEGIAMDENFVEDHKEHIRTRGPKKPEVEGEFKNLSASHQLKVKGVMCSNWKDMKVFVEKDNHKGIVNSRLNYGHLRIEYTVNGERRTSLIAAYASSKVGK